MPNERHSSNFGQSQHNFYFLLHLNGKTTGPIFTIFSQDEEHLVELLTHTPASKAIMHFVSEHESKK